MDALADDAQRAFEVTIGGAKRIRIHRQRRADHDERRTKLRRAHRLLKRETTHAFCEDSGLDPWIDPQNSEDRFTRVRVRQAVLPMLEIELGPGIAESLARTAELVREDSEYLDELALAAYDGSVSAGPTSLELSVEALEALAAPIRNRVILRALELFGPTFSRVHVLAVADLVTNWHGQKELTLPGVRVVRTGLKITLKTTKTLKSGAC
jgi:tRNA(Ile)-lysidine synthase